MKTVKTRSVLGEGEGHRSTQAHLTHQYLKHLTFHRRLIFTRQTRRKIRKREKNQHKWRIGIIGPLGMTGPGRQGPLSITNTDRYND